MNHGALLPRSPYGAQSFNDIYRKHAWCSNNSYEHSKRR